MNAINIDFVIAVHDEILRQTQVGRAGVHFDRLQGTLGRVEQQIFIGNWIMYLKLQLGMGLLYPKDTLLLMAINALLWR